MIIKKLVKFPKYLCLVYLSYLIPFVDAQMTWKWKLLSNNF